MSRRTVTRFALPGLLAATLTGPSHAADVAPMPRTAPKTFKLEFEFRWSSDEAEATAPMPRAARPVSVRPPCCAFDCCQELAAAPTPRPVFATDGHTELMNLAMDLFAAEDAVLAPRKVLRVPLDPVPVAPPVPTAVCVPAKPANVPPAAFDTMSRTFDQMLNPPQAPATCPVPVSSHVWPATMSVPAQAAVAPCPLPTTCAKAATTGTWTRELAGVVYVVKVAPDHVTITASSSVELFDGTTHTEGVVITADYHLARDGTTIVGLVTSVDAVIEGESKPSIGDQTAGDSLPELQKSLVDKPFAFSVRYYGDVMAVGNVRFPAIDGAQGAAQVLAVLGGRYTSVGDRPVPKPRAAKPPVLRDILPVPLTANPPSVYIPPQTGIVQASATSQPQPLPPLPRDVSDRLPGVPPTNVTIPQAPPLMPANLNSTPLIPYAEPAKPEVAPTPRTGQKPGKKGKKKVTNE